MKTVIFPLIVLATIFIVGCTPSPTEGIVSVIDLNSNNIDENQIDTSFINGLLKIKLKKKPKTNININ